MITSDDPNEVEELRNYINGKVWRQVEEEKARAVVRQAQMARALAQSGSVKMDGLGQRIGGIDVRTFFRWHQQYPGCWQDEAFVQKMLKDNAVLRAPGFRPHVKRDYKPKETIVYPTAAAAAMAPA